MRLVYHVYLPVMLILLMSALYRVLGVVVAMVVVGSFDVVVASTVVVASVVVVACVVVSIVVVPTPVVVCSVVDVKAELEVQNINVSSFQSAKLSSNVAMQLRFVSVHVV